MRPITLPALTVLLILTACQPSATTETVPAVILPTATVAPQPATSPNSFAFDGFNMLDAHSGWAWKGISQLYHTDDGGATWHDFLLQGRMQVPGAQFLSGQEAWLLGVPGSDLKQGVFHTADGGRTWTQLSQLQATNASLYFHDSEVGWALNDISAAGDLYHQVYQTLDGGLTWQQLHPTDPQGAQPGPVAGSLRLAAGDALSFTPPSTIWKASGFGLPTPYAGLTVSHDNGQSWGQIDHALPASVVAGQPSVAASAPQFVSDQQAFLPVTVGDKLIFFRSQDAGSIWHLLPPVLHSSEKFPRVQFVSADDGFAVCASKLCLTRDGAQTWQELQSLFSFDPSSTGDRILQFDFVDAATGWAILLGVDGQSSFLKTTDGGRTWLDIQPRIGF